MDGVGMCCTHDIWSSLMDGTVNEKSCLVQDLHFAVIENVALVIYSEQIALVDQVEVHAKRINLN